jgi:hypothetical protein
MPITAFSLSIIASSGRLAQLTELARGNVDYMPRDGHGRGHGRRRRIADKYHAGCGTDDKIMLDGAVANDSLGVHPGTIWRKISPFQFGGVQPFDVQPVFGAALVQRDHGGHILWLGRHDQLATLVKRQVVFMAKSDGFCASGNRSCGCDD